MHRVICSYCRKDEECGCSMPHNHFRRWSMPCNECQSKMVAARCPACRKPHFTTVEKANGFCRNCQNKAPKQVKV